MRVNHEELLRELWEMTEHDGFVATCIDLKENMIFYDRDLVLAGYSGAVEALITTTLLFACLDSDEAAEKSIQAVRRVIWEMPSRVVNNDSPVDIQVLVESFLRIGGWILVERTPVLLSAFSHYVKGEYDVDENLDVLLCSAQQKVDDEPEAALDLVGRVGALVLRGRRVRPCWAVIAKPRLQIWLAGLHNALAHCASGPVSFPIEEISRERERRQIMDARSVVDLQAFRKYRRPMQPVRTAQDPTDQDQVDRLMEALLSGGSIPKRSDLRAFRTMEGAALPLLLAVVKADHLRRQDGEGDGASLTYALRVLSALKNQAAVDPLIRLVAETSPKDDVYEEATKALERLGPHAVDRVVEMVQNSDNPPTCLPLANILGRARHKEKVYGALVSLFRKVNWEHGKQRVASALAAYGDKRAIPLLEEALDDPELQDHEQLREMQWALGELQYKAQRTHKARQARSGRRATHSGELA